jgi:hypothetical protein
VNNGRRLVSALLLATALVGFATAALRTASRPLGLGDDYLAIWGLKARALYRTGSLASVFRVDPAGESSHPEYPPLWPLVLSETARVEGRFDELSLAQYAPALHALAVILAAASTRARGPFRLMPAAAVALLGYFLEPGYAGLSERLLLVFVLGALAVVPRLDTAAGLAGFAALLTLAAWTKQEGALAALVAAGALLLARRPRAALVTAGSALAFAVVPWLVLVKRLASVPPPRAFALALFDTSKLLPAARTLWSVALKPKGFWIAGALLLLCLSPAASYRRRAELFASVAYSAALFLSILFSRFDPAWHVRWSWDRIALVPTAVWLVILAEAAEEAIMDRRSSVDNAVEAPARALHGA